jgi:hypothetical protein
VQALPSTASVQDGETRVALTRRDLLRFAGLAAVLAACGSRRTTADRVPDVDDATDLQRRPQRDPPSTAEEAPEPEPAPEPAPAPDPEPTPDPDPDSADEAAAPTRVEVLCRDAWGAAPATPSPEAHTIAGLMVHHTGVRLDDNRDAPERLRLHQRHHQAQGWSDLAYHVGVDLDGNVYELRDPAVPGQTGTPYDPTGWLLVVAEGNFDEQDPTEEQLTAIAQVLAWAARVFDVDPADISTHRHHVPTTRCPGEALFTEVTGGGLARRVQQHLAGGVELATVCGPEAAGRVAAIEAGSA